MTGKGTALKTVIRVNGRQADIELGESPHPASKTPVTLKRVCDSCRKNRPSPSEKSQPPQIAGTTTRAYSQFVNHIVIITSASCLHTQSGIWLGGLDEQVATTRLPKQCLILHTQNSPGSDLLWPPKIER
jgi:hypothetical protein